MVLVNACKTSKTINSFANAVYDKLVSPGASQDMQWKSSERGSDCRQGLQPFGLSSISNWRYLILYEIIDIDLILSFIIVLSEKYFGSGSKNFCQKVRACKFSRW